MSITVVHPQIQHSHQVAWALAECGLLENYVTSCFFPPGRLSRLPNSLRRELVKRYNPHIPQSKVVTFPYLDLAWKLGGKIFPLALNERLFYYNVWGFDAIMADRVAASPTRIVVGYENSCSNIFKAAKKAGKYCVLDASATHYLSHNTIFQPLYTKKLLARINARKEEEIVLADHILTLSGYSKETYVKAGVPESKITVISLGVDEDKFPAGMKKTVSDYFRYLFIGNVKVAKGVDILIDAFNKIEVPNKRLTIIGSMGDASPLFQKRQDNIDVKGHIPHDELWKEYNEADVFLLPSRSDGFGMVVTEAMSTATPVIVSSHVGAKDLVEHGVNGWIFESGDFNALASAMQEAYKSRHNLVKIGEAAKATARRYSWEAYRENIRNFYLQILKGL